RHSYLGGISPSRSKPRWHSEIGDRRKTVTFPACPFQGNGQYWSSFVCGLNAPIGINDFLRDS
ncbi:hypothetical protein, partial [Croceicoccus naphthovorans]|uniref:hypothetical protein n=1 Tax=Croceicoccus naphthovorans TaxID=1348774 RepID=UPI001C86E866